MARKWLVETTGEVRPPNEGDYYLAQIDGTDTMIRSCGLNPCDRPILRVTEITDQQFFLVDEFTGKQHGGPYKWEETAALARSQLENRSPDREWNLQITTYKGES